MEDVLSSFTRESRFADLVEAVQYCSLCPRLCERVKVLSSRNGAVGSAVMFIAEAPGRLGADRTGVPLCGDQTGDNFERLLRTIGWRREDVFITNAVLCNPREETGNNGPPTPEELENCSSYLEMTIEAVDPAMIVTLGATALKALESIFPHRLNLAEAVARPTSWAGRVLFPMYHPGPRALVHRGFAKQTADFMVLSKLVDPRTGLKTAKATRRRKAAEFSPQALLPFHHLVCTIVQALGRITYFRLTKLLYLIDLSSIEQFRCSVTGEIYIRQPDGPWPPALQRLLPALERHEVILSNRGRIQMIEPGPSPRFAPSLDEKTLEIVAEVLERYGNLSNSQIKTVAYGTSPMRYVLRQERQGRNMQRFPIIYKNKYAPETEGSE